MSAEPARIRPPNIPPKLGQLLVEQKAMIEEVRAFIRQVKRAKTEKDRTVKRR